MPDFRQRLCDFMTECKNDALLELKNNETYSIWKDKSAALYALLITHMTPDCLEIFKKYGEAVNAINGIEADYCYMCGIRDYLNIEKEFHVPHGAQWDEFVSHMIPAFREEEE